MSCNIGTMKRHHIHIIYLIIPTKALQSNFVKQYSLHTSSTTFGGSLFLTSIPAVEIVLKCLNRWNHQIWRRGQRDLLWISFIRTNRKFKNLWNWIILHIVVLWQKLSRKFLNILKIGWTKSKGSFINVYVLCFFQNEMDTKRYQRVSTLKNYLFKNWGIWNKNRKMEIASVNILINKDGY